MTDRKFPKPEDVQKEFEEFVQKRFGGSVQVFTNQMNPSSEESSTETTKEKVSDDSFEFSFNYTPRQVKEFLDRFVVRQDEAKKALAIAVCDHYNHFQYARNHPEDKFDYAKQNVLILGPTGVGKTYLIRKIADLIGVPFVKADATRFSETGYVGANVDDLIRDLVAQAEGDISKAEVGIVYLDEADKLVSQGHHHGKDVNGRGVQFGLLRLMEETEVDLRSGNDFQSQMQALMEMQRKGKVGAQKVNTGKILFIVSGAFNGLEKIIEKRLKRNAIGFDRTQKQQNSTDQIGLFQAVTTQDFIEFGFEPEFIGRLPVRVSCEHLQIDDLFQILKDSEGSIIGQYVRAFAAYGIETSFTEDALRSIAVKAFREKTGARALMTICENSLRGYKYELPSTTLRHLKVTKSIIENPEDELQSLLEDSENSLSSEDIKEVRQYEANFKIEHQMEIYFDCKACQKISEFAKKQNRSITEVIDSLLHGYEHGLKLIHQSTGESRFTLSEEMTLHPQSYLESLIRHSFASDSKN